MSATAATISEDAPHRGHYFCRTCGVEHWGEHAPEGWYAVSRFGKPFSQTMRPGHRHANRYNLGLFCSIECLAKRLARWQRDRRS